MKRGTLDFTGIGRFSVGRRRARAPRRRRRRTRIRGRDAASQPHAVSPRALDPEGRRRSRGRGAGGVPRRVPQHRQLPRRRASFDVARAASSSTRPYGRLRKQKRAAVVVPFEPNERGSFASRRAVWPTRRPSGRRPPPCAPSCGGCSNARSTSCRTQFRTVFMLRDVEELSVGGDRRMPRCARRRRCARARSGARALLRESLAREIDVATVERVRLRGRALRSHRRQRARRGLISLTFRFFGGSSWKSRRIVLHQCVVRSRPAAPWRRPSGPTDPQIAHIVRHGQPGRHRRRQAGRDRRARASDVKAFGKQMVTDHTGVNKQAVALVTKLKVTPGRQSHQPEPEGAAARTTSRTCRA